MLENSIVRQTQCQEDGKIDGGDGRGSNPSVRPHSCQEVQLLASYLQINSLNPFFTLYFTSTETSVTFYENINSSASSENAKYKTCFSKSPTNCYDISNQLEPFVENDTNAFQN